MDCASAVRGGESSLRGDSEVWNSDNETPAFDAAAERETRAFPSRDAIPIPFHEQNMTPRPQRCVSSLSKEKDTPSAIEEVLSKAVAGLDGAKADIALVFVTMQHAEALKGIGRAILDRGIARHVIGCTAETVVGENEEVEEACAMAVWACELPGVEVEVLRVEAGSGGLVVLDRYAEEPSRPAESPPRALILIGDPFSFASDPFLKRFGELARGVPVVGGMASGSRVPRANRLLLDGEEYQDGAVALVLRGEVALRTVVSQGCRPIGRHLIVTKVDGPWIREIGRRKSLEVLQEIFEELAPEDQDLARQGLHIGRVINEYQESFHRGDFLVRNVQGADEAGGIAITDLVRVGQTVQFHVRDAATADEDLRLLLEVEHKRIEPGALVGGLLFSCNGRGSRLFDVPNHDLEAIHKAFGPIPVAGFFAMGELGPIGAENSVHGFTASVVLFERTAPSPE